MYWVEFFINVGESGEKGILTKELSEEMGITQGIASRMVKLLSTFKEVNPETGISEVKGQGLFMTYPDDEYRHRQRVRLSSKGKDIFIKVLRMLEE